MKGDLQRRWTHLSPASSSVPNTTNPYLHPYQSPDDTRTSSTASLLPPPSAVEAIRTGQSTQRTLLCVFIHGFVGDETSFRSFPAHFHELLTILVEDTHVVHTKVYPRFKTRDKMAIAVENFSRWLSQFESSTTDVILLGHSMGGLVAADVALMNPFAPGRHRLLGTISFDTPFMGIHPGVVKSGLASLFKPGEKPAEDPQIPDNLYGSPRTSWDDEDGWDSNETASVFSGHSGHSAQSNASKSTFTMPTPKPKKSVWQSGMEFLKKHHGGVQRAALAYVNGHLEFSGAMLDFGGMKRRYQQIRALEKPDLLDRRRWLFGNSGREHGVWIPRVRFVNYFTVSTGRPKREKSLSGTPRGIEGEMSGLTPIASPSEPVIPIIVAEGSTTPPPPAYTPGDYTSHIPDDDKSAHSATASPLRPSSPNPQAVKESYADLRKKEKTFCIIPREEDTCWVKVKMENVDEVGAHCGLFFINGVPGVETPPAVAENPDQQHYPLSTTMSSGSGIVSPISDSEEAKGTGFAGGAYERLLGDVTQRIEGWCREWIDEIRHNPALLEETGRWLDEEQS
ncbi:hypothetical protein ABW20_dc0103471 [Dactylellina cionopaga]|nr:hypothetical protein ABW20_dc0103471 [Dactylellina cionopaga]